VVVGGGFIGIEMVENLVHRGLATTLVEMQTQVIENAGGGKHKQNGGNLSHRELTTTLVELRTWVTLKKCAQVFWGGV
jgi:pyruvate/2-oxoglutarate dehydrogenase complex dihydrolipoamide dehydrogenase (E3) component